jgi:hypothetical protein
VQRIGAGCEACFVVNMQIIVCAEIEAATIEQQVNPENGIGVGVLIL